MIESVKTLQFLTNRTESQTTMDFSSLCNLAFEVTSAITVITVITVITMITVLSTHTKSSQGIRLDNLVEFGCTVGKLDFPLQLLQSEFRVQ